MAETVSTQHSRVHLGLVELSSLGKLRQLSTGVLNALRDRRLVEKRLSTHAMAALVATTWLELFTASAACSSRNRSTFPLLSSAVAFLLSLCRISVVSVVESQPVVYFRLYPFDAPQRQHLQLKPHVRLGRPNALGFAKRWLRRLWRKSQLRPEESDRKHGNHPTLPCTNTQSLLVAR